MVKSISPFIRFVRLRYVECVFAQKPCYSLAVAAHSVQQATEEQRQLSYLMYMYCLCPTSATDFYVEPPFVCKVSISF